MAHPPSFSAPAFKAGVCKNKGRSRQTLLLRTALAAIMKSNAPHETCMYLVFAKERETCDAIAKDSVSLCRHRPRVGGPLFLGTSPQGHWASPGGLGGSCRRLHPLTLVAWSSGEAARTPGAICHSAFHVTYPHLQPHLQQPNRQGDACVTLLSTDKATTPHRNILTDRIAWRARLE